MRHRLSAAAALVTCALIVSSGPATAAGPHLEDPAGDYAVAAGDVVAATFSTVRGRNTPALQIELTLAGAPSQPAQFSYTVGFTAGECVMDVMYYGAAESASARCVTDGLEIDGYRVPVMVSVKGSTISMRMPLNRDVAMGVVLSDLAVVTSPGGLLAGRGAPLGDSATSEKTYRVGTR